MLQSLWGKKTGETQALLREYHGATTRAACIGPGGREPRKYAAIVTGTRTAARCGIGTVMGSKKLKAIAINARRRYQHRDPGRVAPAHQGPGGVRSTPTQTYSDHKRYGTTEGSMTRNALGIYPTRTSATAGWRATRSSPTSSSASSGQASSAVTPARRGAGRCTPFPAGRPYAGRRARVRSTRATGPFQGL